MNIRYGNTYELIQLSDIGTNCTRRKISRSMGPWNKPEHRSLARGFMPRKPVDRRRAERDSSGHPSGNIDLIQRKDWSIWADKMISSRGIYSIVFTSYLACEFKLSWIYRIIVFSISGKREQIINKALPGEVEKPFSPGRAIIFVFFTDDSCCKDRSLEQSGHPLCRCSTTYCFLSFASRSGSQGRGICLCWY